MMLVETRLAEAEVTGLAVDCRQVLRIARALHGRNCQMPAQRDGALAGGRDIEQVARHIGVRLVEEDEVGEVDVQSQIPQACG